MSGLLKRKKLKIQTISGMQEECVKAQCSTIIAENIKHVEAAMLGLNIRDTIAS